MAKLSGKNITVPLARKILGMPGHASSAFNRCVGNQLRGKKATNRAEAMKNFSSAASSCKGKRG